MEQKQASRRDFLESAAILGAAALATRGSFKVLAAEPVAPAGMRLYVCSVCGHIEFGSAPEFCPVCHAPKAKFGQNDAAFASSDPKYQDLAEKHTPSVTARKKSGVVTEAPSIAVEAKVGKRLHPMEEAHHIRFIDFYIDDKYVSRMLLTLGSHPTAGMDIKTAGSKVRVVALCNLHGYWQAQVTPV